MESFREWRSRGGRSQPPRALLALATRGVSRSRGGHPSTSSSQHLRPQRLHHLVHAKKTKRRRREEEPRRGSCSRSTSAPVFFVCFLCFLSFATRPALHHRFLDTHEVFDDWFVRRFSAVTLFYSVPVFLSASTCYELNC